MSLIDYTSLSPEVKYPKYIAFVFVGGPRDGEILWGKTRNDVLGVLRPASGGFLYVLQGFLNNDTTSKSASQQGAGVAHTQAIYEWGLEKCQHG